MVSTCMRVEEGESPWATGEGAVVSTCMRAEEGESPWATGPPESTWMCREAVRFSVVCVRGARARVRVRARLHVSAGPGQPKAENAFAADGCAGDGRVLAVPAPGARRAGAGGRRTVSFRHALRPDPFGFFHKS